MEQELYLKVEDKLVAKGENEADLVNYANQLDEEYEVLEFVDLSPLEVSEIRDLPDIRELSTE